MLYLIMDATAVVLLSLACPALAAVCLYRASHRKHHRSTTAAVWLLGPAALVAPVIGAQHTQGWGVVGWIVNLATAAACLVHLLPHKKQASRKKASAKPRTAKAKDTSPASKKADHPVLVWGRNFWGTHRPWLPKKRPQALTDHREQIIKAMAEEARTLNRTDVLDDSLAELHQAYEGKR